MREIFERAILEEPDDPAGYAAYADWLYEQRDPRGEFMQVQIALEDERRSPEERDRLREREVQLLATHQTEWLGPLAPFFLTDDSVELWDETSRSAREVPNIEWRFARGFLSTVTIRSLHVPLARSLRDAPQTPFLRELVIEEIRGEPQVGEEDVLGESYVPGPDVPTMESDNIHASGIFPLVNGSKFRNLRYLRIGDEMDMDACLTAEYGVQHHTYCNPAGPLVSGMPRLEELHLLCKDFDPVPVFQCPTLTNLRVLRVYHLGERGTDVWRRGHRSYPAYPLDVLAENLALANLTHLLFHPHHEEGRGSFLPLDEVTSLLNSKHLKRLTHLQLRLSDMGDAGCRAFVDSGILKQLRWLDLRHGCITDEGARLLAACPELKNLEHLDLSRNALTEDGIAALGATGVPLRADRQQTAAELAEEQYLREGDFE
jgi:uncharacterized protein (TIGR02996 family)